MLHLKLYSLSKAAAGCACLREIADKPQRKEKFDFKLVIFQHPNILREVILVILTANVHLA